MSLAAQIATAAHVGQFRRDGITPYIKHPEAVAARLKGENQDTIDAAWLHDVLEDTPMTAGDLRRAGIREPVIQAVLDLTKRGDGEYYTYLGRVRGNPIALKVKIADMLHNLSDSPTEKQIIKYAKGLLALLA